MNNYSKKALVTAIIILLASSTIFANLNIKHVEAQESALLYVSPTNCAPTAVGEVFQIQVKIQQYSPTTRIFKYEFKLSFNNTQLECLDASQGNFFSPDKTNAIIQVDNVSGYVNVNCTLKLGEKPVSGNGVLALITFNATYGVPYPLTRQTSKFHLYDTYLNRADFFVGDINRDQKVGLADLVLLAKAYGSKPSDSNWNPQADLNNDGEVGLGDLVLLAKVYGVEVQLLIPHNLQDGNYTTPWIAPDLALTLTTNKDTYTFGETIYVSGSLTGNGYPINTAYVAIEVDASNGRPIVARAIPTGTIPPTGPIEILSVVPCDSAGNPKSSFRLSTWAYFKVTLKSNSDQQLNNIIVPINVYDSNNATQAVLSSITSIGPGEEKPLILALYIENTFAVGTAKAYANVFSDWVKNGGTALCNEKQATFTVTATSTFAASNLETFQASTTVGILAVGDYAISFNVPSGLTPAGAYTIYVGSKFMEKTVFNTKVVQIS